VRVYLNPGVESYLFNGADLMWPGVQSVEGAFKMYDVVVIYANTGGEKGVPVAVGRVLGNKVAEQGKAVEVSHVLYDELWNMGDKKVPEGVKLTAEVK
jgi:predicted RNA-binding protein (TIGR00451 family)